MISDSDSFSSTNVNVNLTDEEKWLQLPATCFVYRTDDIFALHVNVLFFFFFFFNVLMIIF